MFQKNVLFHIFAFCSRLGRSFHVRIKSGRFAFAMGFSFFLRRGAYLLFSLPKRNRLPPKSLKKPWMQHETGSCFRRLQRAQKSLLDGAPKKGRQQAGASQLLPALSTWRVQGNGWLLPRTIVDSTGNMGSTAERIGNSASRDVRSPSASRRDTLSWGIWERSNASKSCVKFCRGWTPQNAQQQELAVWMCGTSGQFASVLGREMSCQWHSWLPKLLWEDGTDDGQCQERVPCTAKQWCQVRWEASHLGLSSLRRVQPFHGGGAALTQVDFSMSAANGRHTAPKE